MVSCKKKRLCPHPKHLCISQSTAGLKLDLSEAVSNAVTPEGLRADLVQILGQFGMGESKTDKKMMISQIKKYLTENYTKSISNEMLSALFGFVPSYISKIFRQQMGVSPAEYLARLRIEKAKTLLDTRQDLLIREVALLVGYNDPYYFLRAFKKITGLWPSQYQEKGMSLE
jgi:YesN/AraC family two-component response regulator